MSEARDAMTAVQRSVALSAQTLLVQRVYDVLSRAGADGATVDALLLDVAPRTTRTQMEHALAMLCVARLVEIVDVDVLCYPQGRTRVRWRATREAG